MFGVNFRRALLGAGALCLTILPAQAENLLRTTFAGTQTFTAPGLLAIFPSGAQTQTFQVSQAQTVMISFSAVCSTSGTSNERTSIEILLEGRKIYPGGKDNVFCGTAGAATARDGLATHTVVTGAEVEPGFIDIQVRVVPRGGGTSRIDNLSLIVWN